MTNTTVSKTGPDITDIDKEESPEMLQLIPTFSVHGAIDSNQDGLILGFKQTIKGDVNAIPRPIYAISDSMGIRVEAAQTTVFIGNEKYAIEKHDSLPRLTDRWGISEVEKFILNTTTPAAVFNDIKSATAGYIDMPGPGYAGLTAGWVIATYFAHLFQAFPFLFLYGPKEAGKSRLLEILCLLGFNGVKVKDISIAALGDIVDGMRGTLLIDQAETMSRQMKGILADSYKRLGAVRKVIRQSGGRRSILEFSAYGPKAFASTTELDPDLVDRCCRFNMKRTNLALPDFMGYEPLWLELRDQLYRFLLTKWREVQQEYHAIPSNGTRRGELWKPLASVLKVCNVPEEEQTQIRTAFNECTAQTRSAMSVQEVAIFQVLKDEADRHAAFTLSSQEMTSLLKPLLDCDAWITPQAVGKLIKKYGLATEYVKKTRKKQLYYSFTQDIVMDAIERYKIRDMMTAPEFKNTGGDEIM